MPKPPARPAVSLPVLSPLQKVIAAWDDCTKCEYGPRANRKVHVRGKVPCDLLFVGEAPGVSENLIGAPFVGPAGQLQNRILEEATKFLGLDPRVAFINVVACIPLEQPGRKADDGPSHEAVKACRPRLAEMIRLCNPKLVVTLGRHAKANTTPAKMAPNAVWREQMHPAWLLRCGPSNQALEIQKAEVKLRDALYDVFVSPTATLPPPTHPDDYDPDDIPF